MIPEFPKVLKNYNSYFYDEEHRYTILIKCIFCKEIMEEWKSEKKGYIHQVGNYIKQQVNICLQCYHQKFNDPNVYIGDQKQ